MVGIVSRGADVQQDIGQVYTQTSGFEALFGRALQKTGTSISHEDGRTLQAADLAVDEPDSAADGAGGCSVAPRASSLGGLLLGALAALGALRRRKR